MYAFFETMGITRNDFYTGNKIGIGVADCFQKSIRGEKFREHFDLVFFPECVASGQAVEEKARQEAFFADVMKVNRLMGFDLTDWGIASVPVYSVYRTLEKGYQSSDYDFWLFLKDDGKKEALKILVSEMHKRPDPYPGILAVVELLREYDREMMQAYIDGLLSYVHFVSSHAGLDGRRVKACADLLAEMKADDFFATHGPENWPKVPKKKEEYFIPPFRLWDLWDKIVIGVGLLGAILIFVLFLSAEIPGAGAIVSGVLFSLWLLFAFNTDSTSAPSGRSRQHSGGGGHSVSGGFDMTKDYYGKHGEFDTNDESRRASEDIQQFHNSHPDTDLTDHYYWDDVLDAKTDGYLDGELL